MIVWKGAGFVVGIFAVLGLGLAGVLSEHLMVPTDGWPTSLGFVLAAAPCWPTGKSLNKHPGESGHTFFFIPVEYWTPIFAVLAVVYGVANLMK